jgi:uncharacterized protein with GYD domain
MTVYRYLVAPNDEAAMEFGLKVGSIGNIRTTTFKVFLLKKRLQESLIS